jgi:nicotinate phosphoribosyltransferase
VKLSEHAAKISTPGLQQVRRFCQDGLYAGDMIYNLDAAPPTARTLIDPLDPTRRKQIADSAESEDLLVPIFRHGKLVYELPSLVQCRERTQMQLDRLHESHKRFLNPHEYPVGLEPSLHQLRTELIAQARGVAPTP